MPILGIIPSRLSKYFPFPSALSLKPANDGHFPLHLSDSDIRHLAGNGFHWSSIGSILMFAWSVLLILLIMMLAQTHEASEPMRVDLSPRLLPLVFSVPRVPAPPLRLGAPPRADRCVGILDGVWLSLAWKLFGSRQFSSNSFSLSLPRH